VEIGYRASRRIEKPVFGFSLKTGNGFYVFGTNTQIMNVPIEAIAGEGSIRLTLDPLTLMHGNFFLSLSIHSWNHTAQYHRREDWYPFSVRNPGQAQGVFALPCAWRLSPS
jgi:hypothetical protein